MCSVLETQSAKVRKVTSTGTSHSKCNNNSKRYPYKITRIISKKFCSQNQDSISEQSDSYNHKFLQICHFKMSHFMEFENKLQHCFSTRAQGNVKLYVEQSTMYEIYRVVFIKHQLQNIDWTKYKIFQKYRLICNHAQFVKLTRK